MEAFGAACRREHVSLEARKSSSRACIHVDGKQNRRGQEYLAEYARQDTQLPLACDFAQQEVGLQRADSHTALLPGLSGELRN